MTTYKAVGRPILNYAAPVWTPLLSDTGFKRLQIDQNAALRTASGCLAMSSIDHLHQETAMLPVRDHNVLLTDQFYAAAGNPAHPNHHLVYEPDPPREMKHTIQSLAGKLPQTRWLPRALYYLSALPRDQYRPNGTPHDTAHLFNYPAHPTDLKPIDLWNKPAEAAAHVIPLL
ncbi:hypothetical protein AAVH_15284 [Aphelenchoides avenae]|nr:hypothetical protein AAVH_15284 [Aphelenchus avenae]